MKPQNSNCFLVLQYSNTCVLLIDQIGNHISNQNLSKSLTNVNLLTNLGIWTQMVSINCETHTQHMFKHVHACEVPMTCMMKNN
jgi:hypothetical protein